ncbi:aminotransferase class IV [Stakelama tenebrarum]|uniref:Probable branched-chain-amino-acid aminotransferase n=1 Tax=Stakelama tenebrarum TaxID=2711215 RepID=A0A6G6Y8H7_9SPHN|nr:aminotransferase class IV [Sphingosinithalassobacter tenebrarum]QIG81151.1 aminotransferase class IV [Sphingosinithalassobacter tenebrarum]
MAGSQDFTPDPRNANLLVHLNGELVPHATASVSIFDAGFGLGDGVWEGLRLHKGALLFLDAHLDRLYAGADDIRIDIGLTRAEMKAALRDLLIANDMQDGAHLRLMVTRGRKATVNQDPRNALGRPTIAITAEYKAPAQIPGGGLTVQSVTTRTSGPEMFDMRLNSHSRLNFIRALLEAIDIDPEADEALMCDPHGNVASCNATNFFWVKGGTVFVAGDRYCFNGITRGNVILACRGGVAPIEQGSFPLERVYDADEAFVTGTMGGITPVRAIDGRELPQVNGPVTQAVTDAYQVMKDADAAANRLV